MLRRLVKQLCARKGGRLSTFHDVLRGLLLLPGATYSCVADRVSGDLVAEAGEEPVDPAVVVRWARAAADFLAAAEDDLDDLMITSRWSYRLVRPVDDGDRGPLLLHLCLDRSRANLAVARRELSRVRLAAAEMVPQPRVPAPPPAQTLPAVGPPARAGCRRRSRPRRRGRHRRAHPDRPRPSGRWRRRRGPRCSRRPSPGDSQAFFPASAGR